MLIFFSPLYLLQVDSICLAFFFVYIALSPLDNTSVRMGVAASSLESLYIMHHMTLQRLCEHSLASKPTVCPLKDY